MFSRACKRALIVKSLTALKSKFFSISGSSPEREQPSEASQIDKSKVLQ